MFICSEYDKNISIFWQKRIFTYFELTKALSMKGEFDAYLLRLNYKHPLILPTLRYVTFFISHTQRATKLDSSGIHACELIMYFMEGPKLPCHVPCKGRWCKPSLQPLSAFLLASIVNLLYFCPKGNKIGCLWSLWLQVNYVFYERPKVTLSRSLRRSLMQAFIAAFIYISPFIFLPKGQ